MKSHVELSAIEWKRKVFIHQLFIPIGQALPHKVFTFLHFQVCTWLRTAEYLTEISAENERCQGKVFSGYLCAKVVAAAMVRVKSWTERM